MQEMQISTEVIASTHQQSCEVDNSKKETSELLGGSTSLTSKTEGAQSNTAPLADSRDHQMKVDSAMNGNSTGKSENADDFTCSRKRLKLDEAHAVQSVALEATEDSVLDWLKNFKDGVKCLTLQIGKLILFEIKSLM